MFHRQSYQDLAALVARLALATLFIYAGYNKIVGFEGVARSIAGHGIPLAEVAAVITILIELVGGLMIAVGFQTRWAALAIALFIIPINYFYHPFWADAGEANAFFKNLCVLGGMLMITVHGPGRFALQRD